ncbi:type IV secretion system protein VirB1 [Luteibacter rhizovicinus]|uniref:Type IV secretion system protein VirB1 n=1 Tax=Luteibacter rhizovicinus TaxID=242606 RepID=A0A4R3YZB0_9GAMM|nr:lytic transglycosylase domain-containing protein [Luteibacter rhizovicinus]TCV97228.1 type IV secretion system protein VirB1 [Luteibacter rhizovicinus]
MLACQNLAVPAEVMQHIVEVESGRNPFAIGVVGAQLVRQPQNLGEAMATVRMLDEKGYNYSLGIAQVNRANLGKFGLDSYEKAFQVCPNLVAGSQILAACYASAGGDWGKSFSCYYSGNFTTGFQDGYVQKVYASIGQQAPDSTSAIPLQVVNATANPGGRVKGVTTVTTDGPAYRVAIRSVLDAAASAAIAPALATAIGSNVPNQINPATGMPVDGMHGAQSLIPTQQTGIPVAQQPVVPMNAAAVTAVAGQAVTQIAQAIAAAPKLAANQPIVAGAPGADIFVPQVRGPGEPESPPTGADATPPSPTAQSAAVPAPSVPMGDQADLRTGVRDDAFVF